MEEQEEKPFTITYSSDAVSFRCVCGSPLIIHKYAPTSSASGIFCQQCDAQWWVSWREGILHKGTFDPASS